MSAESSSLSLVLASSKTMRDVSGMAQSARFVPDDGARSVAEGQEPRQSFRDHMNEVAGTNRRAGIDNTPEATENRQKTMQDEPDKVALTEETATADDLSNPEEPSANQEPSANKEPSAEREPSANKEPSADKEPSANKEPSADKEPSAYEAPSANKAPSADSESLAGKELAASDKAPSADGLLPAQHETTDSGVPSQSLSNSTLGLQPDGTTNAVVEDTRVFTANERLVDLDALASANGKIAADDQSAGLARLLPASDGELGDRGNRQRNLADLIVSTPTGKSAEPSASGIRSTTGLTFASNATLHGLLLSEQQASNTSPASPLLGTEQLATVNPLSYQNSVASNQVVLPSQTNLDMASQTRPDLRMQVRQAVLGLANRNGSALPPSDQKLPPSASETRDASALNALLSTADGAMKETAPLPGVAPGGGGTAPLNTEAEVGKATGNGRGNSLPHWQSDSSLSGFGSARTGTGTAAMPEMGTQTSTTSQPAASATIAVSAQAGDASASASATMMESLEGLPGSDGDSVESRTERSIFAGSPAGRNGTVAGQTVPGNSLLTSGAATQSFMNSPVAMSASQGALQMDQSLMQARVGQQIMMMHEKGISSARIRLDPPELGSLLIKLEVQDRSAVVHFTAQNHMVRDSLEQQLPRLQDMMDDMGLELSDASVESQLGGQENASQGEGSESDERQNHTLNTEAVAAETQQSSEAVTGVLSLVDQYV